MAELRAAGGARALLKCYSAKSYACGKTNATAFASRGPLRLARLLGHADGRGLLVFEWAPGRLLSDICTAPEFDGRSLTLAGSALAALHGQQVCGLACRTREDEAANLLAMAAEVATICPPLARRADGLARRVGALLAGAPAVHVPLHGDLSAKQVLVGELEAAIVDFDRACCGDPAADLGNVIAAAERYALRGLMPPSRVEPLRDTLFEGYARGTNGRVPGRIQLYWALGLLRRAHLPFYAHEPDWPRGVEWLVERAEAVLNRE